MATRWLSVKEAAAALGVSEKTVRRRVRRQMLESRRGDGGRIEVCAPVPDAGGEAPVSIQRQAAANEPSAGPTAGFIAKAGRYSPLPASAHDTPTTETDATTNPATRPTTGPATHAGVSSMSAPAGADDRHDEQPADDAGGDRPGFRPGKLLGDGEEAGTEDVARRFQRLAGASMMLAQRHADDAHEQLVHARGEIHRLRKLCQGALIAVAATAVLGLFIVGVLGARASNANTRLEAQRERTEAAELAMQRADEQRWQVTEQLMSLHAALAEHIDTLDAEQVEALSRLMNERPGEAQPWREDRARPRRR